MCRYKLIAGSLPIFKVPTTGMSHRLLVPLTVCCETPLSEISSLGFQTLNTWEGKPHSASPLVSPRISSPPQHSTQTEASSCVGMTPLAAQILSLLSLSPEYPFTKHVSGSWLPYEYIPTYLIHPKGGAQNSTQCSAE